RLEQAGGGEVRIRDQRADARELAQELEEERPADLREHSLRVRTETADVAVRTLTLLELVVVGDPRKRVTRRPFGQDAVEGVLVEHPIEHDVRERPCRAVDGSEVASDLV